MPISWKTIERESAGILVRTTKKGQLRDRAEEESGLLQLRVLGFGLLQDGDVGVGIFPEGEEIFVGGECFGLVASERIRPAQSQARQCSRRAAPGDSTMVAQPGRVSNALAALNMGVDYMVQKPVELESFISGLDRLLRLRDQRRSI